MVSFDSVATSATTRPGHPKMGTIEPQVLAKALDVLGIENNERWAQDNYKRVVRDLCSALNCKRIIEIGGGRDPLFTRDEFASLGVDMTENDVSSTELAVLPAGYCIACFDVAGDISSVSALHGTFDLAFSRMVFEHVADGQRAWRNLYELLAPSGVALAFIPTLYSVPFMINWLLPDKLAGAIVKLLFKHRTDDEDPVFPARYSWTFAGNKRMSAMLKPIGYREVVILPFYGHGYYTRFPIVRDIHKWFTEIARRRDWRLFASYAYIAVRK